MLSRSNDATRSRNQAGDVVSTQGYLLPAALGELRVILSYGCSNRQPVAYSGCRNHAGHRKTVGMPIIPPVMQGSTPDLPEVPPLVQYLIGGFLEPILAWLAALVYRPLLLRCADHPLVLLAQWYDPSAVVAACATYHHPADRPGRPPASRLSSSSVLKSSAPGPTRAPTRPWRNCSVPTCWCAGSSVCRSPRVALTIARWPIFMPS